MDEQSKQSRRQPLLWLLLLFTLAAAVVGLLRRRARQSRRQPGPRVRPLELGKFQGLSEAEAAAQQLFATGRIDKLLDQARPMATTIREGQLRSIEVSDIVADDLLVIGPGDEFLAEGKHLTAGQKLLNLAAVKTGQRSREKGI